MVKEGEGEGVIKKGIIRTYWDIDEHIMQVQDREMSFGFSAYFQFAIMDGETTVLRKSPRLHLGPFLSKDNLREKMIEFAEDFDKTLGDTGIEGSFVENVKKMQF